MFKDSLTKFTS